VAKTKKTASSLVSIDRRASKDRRYSVDQPKAKLQIKPTGKTSVKPVAELERRVKVNRRRQIDPTTCERDYSGEEVEFMQALDLYKRQSGRMFPTCSEVLEVIRGLGYVKVQPGMTVVPLAHALNGTAEHYDSMIPAPGFEGAAAAADEGYFG